MYKLSLVVALLCLGGWSALAQCPVVNNCGSPSASCPNAKVICTPNAAPVCVGADCDIKSAPDGCGGTVSTDCGPCCPASCTVDGIYKPDGTPVVGTCGATTPPDTIAAGYGTCPTKCGKCNLPSAALCKTTSNGPCSKRGNCSCFVTISGASCAASNFKYPGIAPSNPAAVGNGGGCEEDACNAAAQKNDAASSAACCPVSCK